MRYNVSVPGSIMLLGEHAVLQGHRAIACAINQRVHIELIPHNDTKIIILSDRLGHYSTDIKNIVVVKPFEFVLLALKHYQDTLSSGCTLRITAEFSHQMGLGSSAAVTVGTVVALQYWLNRVTDQIHLFNECLNIIHSVQGLGSGADLAASILGGVIALKNKPLTIEKLTDILPITLIYSGSKTPTVEVVNRVNQASRIHQQLYNTIFQGIGECVEEGYNAIKQQDWIQLGKIFSIQQGLMEALGVSTKVLQEIIQILSTDPGIIAAKISGSGLGDCVVGLGKITRPDYWKKFYYRQKGIQQIDISVSECGVVYEGM